MQQKQSKVKINMQSQSSNQTSIKVEKIQFDGFKKKKYSSEQLQTEPSDTDDQKSQVQLKIESFLSYCQEKDQQNIFFAYLKQAQENQKFRNDNFIQLQKLQQYFVKYKQQRDKRAQLEAINQDLRKKLIALQEKTEQQNINEIDQLKYLINCKNQQMYILRQQNQQQNNQIIKLQGQITSLKETLSNDKKTHEKYKRQAISKITQNRKTIENKDKQIVNVNQALQKVKAQIQKKDGAIELANKQVERCNAKIKELLLSIQKMQMQMNKNKNIKIQSDKQVLRLNLYQNSMSIQVRQQHLLEKQKKLRKLADQLYLLAQKMENASNAVV